MASHAGPKITQTGVLLLMDAASNKYTGKDVNLLSNYPWTVGTGSNTFFNQNGDGNSRILDTNPHGATDVIWDVSNQDVASDADGGWNTSAFAVDPTKLYRYSVWVRRKTIGNGSFYLGLSGYNSSLTNIGVLNRSNGANNTNPYFSATAWWGAAGTWYLVVGHVWPAGSGVGATHPDSGIYTVSGIKVGSTGDFVWRSDNLNSNHRSYLYYSTNIATNQQFFDPRVDIIDLPSVNAPTLNKLHTNVNSRWNLLKKVTDTVLSLRKVYVNPITNSFVFGADDIDKSISIPLAANFNKLEGTISCWIKPYGYNGSNGIFVNKSDSAANAVDWLWVGSWSSGALFYFRLGNGSTCCNNDLIISNFSTLVPINKWAHLAVSWKSAGISKIYINGNLHSSRTISAIPATSPSTEGRVGLGHVSAASGSWNGEISRFSIHSIQLPDAEIRKNFNAIRSRYGV